MEKRKALVWSFFISFIYVAISTLVAMSVFPIYNIIGYDDDLLIWRMISIITYPGSFLLFGLLIVDKSIVAISILQSLAVVVFSFFVFKMMYKKKL